MLVNDEFAGIGLLEGGLEHVDDIIQTLALSISSKFGGAVE